MKRLSCLLGMTLLAVGCAPVNRLVKQRRFSEAMCGAKSFSRRPQRDFEVIRGGLHRAARPRFHLQAMPREELVAALGEAGARLADRAVVLRSTAAIDAVDVDRFDLSVLLVNDRVSLRHEAPDLVTLARYLGEKLPTAKVVRTEDRREWTRGPVKRPLLGLVAAALEIATLTIVPVTLITGHTRIRRGSTRAIEPTDAEVAAAAPATAAMFEAMQRYRGGHGSQVWLVPRPKDAATRVVVEWSYFTDGCVRREPTLRRGGSHTRVELRESQVITLSPGPNLETQLDERFGDAMLLLARD